MFVSGKLIACVIWHSSLATDGQPAVSHWKNQVECVTVERVITIQLATRRSGESVEKLAFDVSGFHLRHTGALPKRDFIFFFRNHSRYRRIQFVSLAQRRQCDS